jgi:hypothetical protein
VENTKTFDETPDAQTAYEAGTLLGNYHETMASIPPGRLKPHARDFHSTPAYFQELKSTEKKADSSRFSDPAVREALEFIMDRKPLIHHLSRARESGVLADFVCHNDPKLNNMLFDARNGKGVCLIDLDTVDVGLLPTDFGDAVRSVCRRNIETPEAVAFDLDYFEAFCRGYFELMRGRIDPGTCSLLFDGVRVITLELSIRYLADFLDGGGYFKTDDPAETLLNAQLQQKLFGALESSRERAGRILDSCFVD